MIILSRTTTASPRRSSWQLLHLCLRLLQPVRHAHLAVHRRRGGEGLLRFLLFACASVELAEGAVATGEEGRHPESHSEHKGLPEGGFGQFHVEGVAPRVDLTAKPPRPSLPSPLPAPLGKLQGSRGTACRVAVTH